MCFTICQHEEVFVISCKSCGFKWNMICRGKNLIRYFADMHNTSRKLYWYELLDFILLFIHITVFLYYCIFFYTTVCLYYWIFISLHIYITVFLYDCFWYYCIFILLYFYITVFLYYKNCTVFLYYCIFYNNVEIRNSLVYVS